MSTTETILLILRMLNEAAKLSIEASKLADRILMGEAITEEELKAASQKMKKAVDDWDEAAKPS